MRTIYWAAITLIGICVMTGCKKGAKATETTPIKVTVEKVEQCQTNGTQSFSGTVEEESGTALSFMTSGTIKQIFVSQGQMVSQGALLAIVDETTLRNAYEATLAMRNQAEDAYSRMKLLHDNNSLPEIQWVEVTSKLKQAVAAEQIAKKSLSDSKLYAPYSGFISTKMAEVGQNILPGTPVLKIVKINKVKIKISIPENEINKIKKGVAVRIQVSALEGRLFNGIVTEKGVTANPLSRSYDVRALVDNAKHDLLPGMVCDVSFENTSNKNTAITLPPNVISIDSDNHEFVWINNNGKAAKRFITTGEQSSIGVIIVNGLNGGEEVIVDGGQKVSEGMDITISRK